MNSTEGFHNKYHNFISPLRICILFKYSLPHSFLCSMNIDWALVMYQTPFKSSWTQQWTNRHQSLPTWSLCSGLRDRQWTTQLGKIHDMIIMISGKEVIKVVRKDISEKFIFSKAMRIYLSVIQGRRAVCFYMLICMQHAWAVYKSETNPLLESNCKKEGK